MKKILEEILGSSRKNIILDTDTYNEVDDQFALAYAILCTCKGSRINLMSVNAAPFLNNRSISPEDGMEKSYNEINRIIELTKKSHKIENLDIPVYRGSKKFLKNKETPEPSDAVLNIINAAKNTDGRVYIVAIGAITNVASAIITEPSIKDKIAVVWLGGHAHHYPETREFNMYQDIPASKVIFDSGVPLVQIPCCGMTTELHTTIPELEYYLRGKNELSDYLVDIVRGYTNNAYAWSKVIWDVSAVACLSLPNSMDRVIIPAPIITSEGTYSFDNARHNMIYVRRLNRDVIFGDMFGKISGDRY